MSEPDVRYRPPGFVDFAALSAANVYPLSVKLLEQGGDILVYREADLASGITRKQNAIFHRLVAMGEHPDSDCKITVLVVTGMPVGPGRTERRMAVYSYLSDPYVKPELRDCTTEEIQTFISSWFEERKWRR